MSLSRSAVSGASIALFLFAAPATAHDLWINHGNYSSPNGEHCCGVQDCQSLAPDAVKITPGGYSLNNGEIVPFSEALGSEDGQYWRCKRQDGSRRCFFAPQPAT
jgi:hypothetical protein